MVSFLLLFQTSNATLASLRRLSPARFSTARCCAFRCCSLQIRSIQNKLFASTDSVETNYLFFWNSLCTGFVSNLQLATSSILVEFKLRQRRSVLTLIQFDLLHQLHLQRRLTVLVCYLPSYLTQVGKSATARRCNSKK
jgi:hypothetical protein